MKLKLVKILDESQDVKSFFWEVEEKLNWIPGQYFYYTLPKLNYDDARGETRHFTISSSPTEGNLLRLTTKFPRPMSGYKKTLLELKIGDEIEGRGPQGTFMQDTKLTDIKLLVAGGIGITPFRSMIKYNFDKNLELPYLIYSNSDENFVFGDELKQMLGEKLVLHNSKISGHLDSEKIELMLKKWQVDKKLAAFYAVGSPKFVDSLENEIGSLNVDSDKIHSEKFSGY